MAAVVLFLGASFQGLATKVYARWGANGVGPALAGNVGAGWAFALSREGDQGVDVPMLAAARGALWNSLRFQKQIPLNGLGLGS